MPKYLLITLFPLLFSTLTSANDCKPGSFQTPQQTCQPCPPGTYQDQHAQTTCKACLFNTIAPRNGSTSCLPCGPKARANHAHRTCVCKQPHVKNHKTGKCHLCPPGTYYNYGYCEQCYSGTFQPKYGQNECKRCEQGTFSKNRATECVRCPKGTALMKDGKCAACPPGKQYSEYEWKCVKCPGFTYKPNIGLALCEECPENTFSNANATACIRCNHGEALMKDGTCGKCEPGHFYQPWSRKCQPCGKGWFQHETGITTQCYKCASNAYSTPGATKCIECPRAQGLMKDGSCAGCPPGKYYNQNHQQCHNCVRNCYSLGSTDPTISNARNLCKPCPPDTMSLQGASKCVRCKQGNVLLKGNTCGICPAGTKYNYEDGSCIPCGPYEFSQVPTANEYCEGCPGGMISNLDRTGCVKCAHGLVLLQPDGRCGKCPAGTYLDEKKAGACKKCPKGLFTDKANTDFGCWECPSGKVADSEGKKCVKRSDGNAAKKDG